MTSPSPRPTPSALAEQRIRAMVDAIPRGRVATYGQIAREAGLEGRARLVGRILGQLPSGSELPWHRVVRSSGCLAVRADGRPSPEQARRLRAEGVTLKRGGRVDLDTYGWRPEW